MDNAATRIVRTLCLLQNLWMTVRRRLIVFTRFPEAGCVKTRLIPALGAERAAALHRRLLLRTLRTAEIGCRLSEADLEVHFDGGSEEAFHHWVGDRYICRAQRGGDLGDRMAHAFEGSFEAGCQAAVIIGSDSPGLTPELLVAAFEKLGSSSVVLGPADDGGYYLIGLGRPVPELFRSITWGTGRVLGESIEILARLRITPALLAALGDIDRPEDLAVWNRWVKVEDAKETVSVVIPALNEARAIVSTLTSLGQNDSLEILVVDGGSADATAEVAQKAGAVVFRSKAGRARQMNAGAAKAGGAVLLFLHADTILPADWSSEVLRILKDPKVAAGAFAFRVAENFRGKRMLERSVNWRARRLQLPYGDQGLFLRRSLFEEVGGFANLPIMEDYELVRRLRRHGKVVTSSFPATTSGRRWKQLGWLRVTLKNQLMIAGFRLGVAPETLARFYRGRG
jgi:rSAM/selenodomain-associated transferase 2/rSAM/selenodomain-associated transferase 1